MKNITKKSITKKMEQIHLEIGGLLDEIPSLIHQTWKTMDIPSHLQKFQKTWIELNPQCEYKLWTDQDNYELIENNYPWFLPYYKNYPHAIQRVDVSPIFYFT